jgi:hypothetical protein
MSGKASPPAAPRGKTTPASARTTPVQAAAAPLPPSAKNGVPDPEAVRARAYFLWEQAGYPEGDGVEFWLLAEQELHSPR